MDTFLNLLLILIGSFFFGLMGYSFYIVLFSKNKENSPRESKHNAVKKSKGELKSKFVGRT